MVRILNMPREQTTVLVNHTEVKDVAEKKFLQETNFQEDDNNEEELIPERRAKDQLWRQAATLRDASLSSFTLGDK
tara:strand:- start:212 stop:439 length:228 start_codon:yes stop_codon:yes gene_type:complete